MIVISLLRAIFFLQASKGDSPREYDALDSIHVSWKAVVVDCGEDGGGIASLVRRRAPVPATGWKGSRGEEHTSDVQKP